MCAVEELAPGQARRVDVEPPIAVFNVAGEFFATDDTCTHAKASLAEGYIDGDQVECPLHFAKFCVRTGRALSLPAKRPLRTHDVVVEDGVVFVEVAVLPTGTDSLTTPPGVR